ncbi:hypothetical protein Tco_0575973, partial [Tanacetum coccineum]
TPTINQPLTSQPQKTKKPRKPKIKDTRVPQPSGLTDIVADEVIHKVLGDSLVRAATTASSLEAEQDSGNITKTQSKATPNESSSRGTTSGGGPRCQETMGDTIAQTRFENISKLSNDSLLTRGNTLRSDKDSLKLKELMELCTNLQQRVLDLEKTKTTQANVGRRINAIDVEEDIILVNVQDDADNEIFDVDALTGDEVFAEQEVVAKEVNLTIDEVTLAQALAALKSVKPKVKGVVIEEPSIPVSVTSASTKVSAATTTTATILTPRKGIVITELGTPTTTISSQQLQDKGKRIMIEEPVKPKMKDVQIMLDEEAAKKLQVEFDEEERLAKEKDKANISLSKEWDDIQAKVDASYQLVERLQAEEQEQFIIEEKATLFKELLEQRRKHFAAKRAEEKRNNPPTKTQQKKTMITYLKNMEGWKHKDLKSKDFDSIKELFDKAFKRVNMFVDFRTDLVKGSSKRARKELEQESTKKQKVDNDKETAELKQCLEIIPDEEEDATYAVLHVGREKVSTCTTYTFTDVEKKLQIDYESEMAYQLIRSIEVGPTWMKLLSDYDCEFCYHPGKANVVADALSRKERIKPLRVRALVLTIGLNLLVQILNAQVEARKKENYGTKDLGGMIKNLEPRTDGTLCLRNRS